VTFSGEGHEWIIAIMIRQNLFVQGKDDLLTKKIVMYVKQSVKILFVLRKAKMTSDGKSHIYCRLTIDRLQEEFKTSDRGIQDPGQGREDQTRKGKKSVVQRACRYRCPEIPGVLSSI
jgi:hypothetical protein